MEKKPYVLWLIWQNQDTRQRYHVGNLFHEDGKYTFSYELSGKRRTLTEAMKNGYKPHLSFRDLEKTYVSDRLFGPFARRLPDKRRPDINEILKDYGLPLDYTYIPAFYSGFMFDVIRNNEIYEAKIEKINPYAKPQLKVNISIVGRLMKGYSTTNSEDVEPVQILV